MNNSTRCLRQSSRLSSSSSVTTNTSSPSSNNTKIHLSLRHIGRKNYSEIDEDNTSNDSDYLTISKCKQTRNSSEQQQTQKIINLNERKLSLRSQEKYEENINNNNHILMKQNNCFKQEDKEQHLDHSNGNNRKRKFEYCIDHDEQCQHRNNHLNQTSCLTTPSSSSSCNTCCSLNNLSHKNDYKRTNHHNYDFIKVKKKCKRNSNSSSLNNYSNISYFNQAHNKIKSNLQSVIHNGNRSHTSCSSGLSTTSTSSSSSSNSSYCNNNKTHSSGNLIIKFKINKDNSQPKIIDNIKQSEELKIESSTLVSCTTTTSTSTAASIIYNSNCLPKISNDTNSNVTSSPSSEEQCSVENSNNTTTCTTSSSLHRNVVRKRKTLSQKSTEDNSFHNSNFNQSNNGVSNRNNALHGRLCKKSKKTTIYHDSNGWMLSKSYLCKDNDFWKLSDFDDDVQARSRGKTQKEIEVPSFREKKYTCLYKIEGTEDLSDHVFEKRHYNYEIEEKKIKKNFESQTKYELQKSKYYKHNEILYKKETSFLSKKFPKFIDLNPNISNIKAIEISNDIPVMAYGVPVKKILQQEFNLNDFIMTINI